ncbi:MAG: N-acetyl sugar amidotransferase [Candidatus Thermoplasmatota archaeon]
MDKKIRYCSRCLMPSTRPRMTFNEEGICNACVHAERKKNEIDWDERWGELEELCNEHRRNDGGYDCIVPCSGGKDGSYVAYKLKHELDMHPLCVTLAPPMPTEIGKKNLRNFIESGYDHIKITPNPDIYQQINKNGFIEQGRPKHGSVTGLCIAPLKIAINFDIPLVFYGEEGESEYGGIDYLKKQASYGRKELIDIYFSGHAPEKDWSDEFTKNELRWWTLPTDEKINEVGLTILHWSHFEHWDPKLHYKVAEKECGFTPRDERSIGTFTNFAQLDDELQDWHAYLMFLKFGFGRATSDACIEIREGRMSREKGKELIKKYDGEFPEKLFSDFLDYMDMTEEAAWNIFDKWANEEILEKRDGRWQLKYPIE